MSVQAGPSTPRGKSTTAVPVTPTTTRIATSASLVQSSPHYATTRRHSLYGIEDRVVIDPGSRIWKLGFSGEGKPRDVFCANGKSGATLWSLGRASNAFERAEEDRLLEFSLQRCLRYVFHKSLLADPKSRKVIIVEHPLLPFYIKEMITRILFDNLQVPSVSFASSHLLSLFSVGRITGLVLDCGHLESTALPIFASRPLYPHLRTTPLAGARLTSHLRCLLLLFGTYIPPPTSLSAAANIPIATRSMRVPQEVLTDAVLEEIKTRCCFVGEALDDSANTSITSGDNNALEMEPPASDSAQSESEFSQFSVSADSNPSSHPASSEFSVVSNVRESSADRVTGEGHLQALSTMYSRHSTATDLHMSVVPPVSQQTGTGRGTLIIPGWIRERAAEVLFEGGDVDESSVAEVILDALLKVPVDLRKTLACSIVVVGGTPMLPGFLPRLHTELIHAIMPRTTAQPTRHLSKPDKPPPPTYDRYASLRPLVPFFAVLNNPSPPPSSSTSERARANAGKAPAFSPAAMAWIGGSLAGSLKTGGVELSREKWDEATSGRDGDEDDSMDVRADGLISDLVHASGILPDWTRTPLPSGAPPAVPTRVSQAPTVVV